uniref:Kinase n=1 Tax=Schistosoma mansoni TaxID=6183 RepID=A0A3Q0KCH5_SCHMA
MFGDVPPLPTCTESYAFQVAGHSRENASSFEILRDKSKPIIYKSLQDRERGMREVMFYQSVFSPDASEALKRLRQFIPTYYGVFQCPGTKAYYMALSDLVADFKQPNICDFKMGTVINYPEDEIPPEQFQYTWRRELGIMLAGIQISDPVNHCLIKLNKAFGRTLTPEQVYSLCVKPFLGADRTYSIKLAQSYITQLNRILNWYVEYGAKELTFCRSSLLLIHESLTIDNSNNDHCSTSSTTITADNQSVNSSNDTTNSDIPISSNGNNISNISSDSDGHNTAHTEVYLIDFVRWKAKSSTNDNDISGGCSKNCWSCELTDGFRHGLETLIKLMQRVVDTENSAEIEQC